MEIPRVVDVYVTPAYPYYLVMVDGKIYDEFCLIDGGPPLTHSQLYDVAQGYSEALN
jgi:hypothetical protein